MIESYSVHYGLLGVLLKAFFMSLKDKFSNRLNFLLEQKGWSDNQLAEKCDLARSYIGKLKKGQASPPLDTIEVIAAALSIDPISLLSPDEISPRQALGVLNEYFNWNFIPNLAKDDHPFDEQEAAKRVLKKKLVKNDSSNKVKKIGQ